MAKRTSAYQKTG